MMSKINGIYAASMSVINKDLTLDVTKTIQHAETIIDQGCHGTAFTLMFLNPLSCKIFIPSKISGNRS